MQHPADQGPYVDPYCGKEDSLGHSIEVVQKIPRFLAVVLVDSQEECQGEEQDKHPQHDCKSQIDLIGELEGEKDLALVEEDVGEVADVGFDDELEEIGTEAIPADPYADLIISDETKQLPEDQAQQKSFGNSGEKE